MMVKKNVSFFMGLLQICGSVWPSVFVYIYSEAALKAEKIKAASRKRSQVQRERENREGKRKSLKRIDNQVRVKILH